MLREAGLPVNAGFSRPASFTAAAAGMQHPAAQLGLPFGGGYGMMATPQAPWVVPPSGWVPQLPPGEPAAWQLQQALPLQQPLQQQEPFAYTAVQLQLPSPQHTVAPVPWVEASGPWQGQAAVPARPPSALPVQQQLLVQAAAVHCHASTSLSLPASPGSASPLRAHSACPASGAPPASCSVAASMRRSGSEGALAASAASTSAALPQRGRLASLSASCSLSQAAEEQLERQQQQRLLKLDSELVASASWRAERAPAAAPAPEPAPEPAGLPGADGAAARPALPAENAAVETGSLQRSLTGGSSGSCLASSALQALVAAAEAEDVPRMESDAVEARQGSSQLEVAMPTSASSSFAVQAGSRLPSAAAEAPPADAAPQQVQPPSCPPAVMPPNCSPPADPLADAAAALARFEQLQSQLQQLQAGIPLSLTGAGAECSPLPVAPEPPPAAAQLPEEASSPVAKVMRQAESFLEQAQQLLQRLHLAAASPQRPAPAAAARPAGQPAERLAEWEAAAQPAVQPFGGPEEQQGKQPLLEAQQPAAGGTARLPPCSLPQDQQQQQQHHAGNGSLSHEDACVSTAAVPEASHPLGSNQPQAVLPYSTAAWHLPSAAPVPPVQRVHQGGTCGDGGYVPWQQPEQHEQQALEHAWPPAQQQLLQQPGWAADQPLPQQAGQQQQQPQQAGWSETHVPQVQAQPLVWQAQALCEQPSQAWLQPEPCYSYAGIPGEQSAVHAQPAASNMGWQGSEWRDQQPLDWRHRQRWEAPGQRGRQAAKQAEGYAQRRQPAASAAGSRPGSAQHRSPERPGQPEQGSYLQAARAAKVRACCAHTCVVVAIAFWASGSGSVHLVLLADWHSG